MPRAKVMHKWKAGTLHSGSEHGPIVKSRKQAIAIMMSYPDGHKKKKKSKRSK